MPAREMQLGLSSRRVSAKGVFDRCQFVQCRPQHRQRRRRQVDLEWDTDLEGKTGSGRLDREADAEVGVADPSAALDGFLHRRHVPVEPCQVGGSGSENCNGVCSRCSRLE